MSAYDLIIVGLGPAGAVLGHRAQARGLAVLGIDTADTWPNTYGLWRDEIPGWLVDAPLISRSFPLARAIHEHRIHREYCIIDNDAWRAALVTFPTLRATATIHSANRVEAGGESFTAAVVIDARGLPYVDGHVAQQAVGWIVDSSHEDCWMDFSAVSLDRGFRYSFEVAGGRLIEDTLLATRGLQDWNTFEASLQESFPDTPPLRVEKVLISLGAPGSQSPALAYGARAGFVNPITGFSVGTSLRFADPTLDALWPSPNSSAQLPWRSRSFRLDRTLTSVIQRALTELDQGQLSELIEPILSAAPTTQRRFLTLGDPVGTIIGMLRVFRLLSFGTRLAVLRSLLPTQTVSDS